MKYTSIIKLSISMLFTLLLLSISVSPVFAAPKTDPNDWLCALLCFGYQPGSASTSGDGTYQSMARVDANQAGIPAEYFVNQIDAESHFNPNAYSSAGAIGIAQIMPDTARAWNVDAYDPVASLKVASTHMHEYYADEGYDYAKALGDYNAGPGMVQRAKWKCMYWLDCMPIETINYVHKIMG